MRTAAVLVALVGLQVLVAGPAAATTFTPGAASLGDPLAPGLGNGGYDVSHYDIRLDYRPATGVLTGTTTVTATTTQDLSRFDLDFALPATAVTVDGTAATFASKNGPRFSSSRDLVVTPAAGVPRGRTMTVVVDYRARPAAVMLSGSTQWNPTPTGFAAWNEPTSGAEYWFPGNDYPSDKATYDVRVTTPAEYTVTTNGRLLTRTVAGDDATVHWRSQPMSTHVSLLAIGRYSVDHTSFGNVPVDLAYENGLGALTQRARTNLARTPAVLTFLQDEWGPYPFDAAGGIVVGQPYPSSLETQTRPVYEAGLWQDNPDNAWVVVHENAHQWFGDSVTFDRWNQIWLAEGFATYSEWVWSQHEHLGTAQQLFLGTYRQRRDDTSFWATPLDRPAYALGLPAYYRGAMLLQALRNRVGDGNFFTIMRSWASQHRHGNASTADFEALATRVAGRDLTAFFAAWVDGTTVPAATVANGFPAGVAATTAGPPASLAAIEASDAALAARR